MEERGILTGALLNSYRIIIRACLQCSSGESGYCIRPACCLLLSNLSLDGEARVPDPPDTDGVRAIEQSCERSHSADVCVAAGDLYADLRLKRFDGVRVTVRMRPINCLHFRIADMEGQQADDFGQRTLTSPDFPKDPLFTVRVRGENRLYFKQVPEERLRCADLAGALQRGERTDCRELPDGFTAF